MQWQFGPYQVEGLIARGGMGEIVRAYDTRHDRVVALKLLAPHLAEDPEFRERFKREAHAAGRLNEPHVIPIHGYGEIDGRLYLDMRLVEGQDLGALLSQHGVLRPIDVVTVIEQVASALDAAHREGVVHRDVKPSNVLIGDGGFAYLVDFGIAASLRDSAHRTSGSTTIGTVSYMAPERFGQGPYDHRADVYSLACMLYQCLTGAKPFEDPTVEALIYAHMNREPPKPSAARPEIPQAFDEVVAIGMAKNPADRFATTGELAQAAREALRGTVPMGTAGDLPRTRSKWPLVLTAVGAVAVLAGAAAAAVSLHPEWLGAPAEAGSTRPAGQPQGSPTTSTHAPSVVPVHAGEELSHDPDSRPNPKDIQLCQRISIDHKPRGIGCFHSDGDKVTARDLLTDGESVKVVAATDYGRTVNCADTNGADGGPVVCPNNLREDGHIHIQVQLVDKGKTVATTNWSRWSPIGR